MSCTMEQVQNETVHVDMEKKKLVSLVWGLREQLEKVTEQNELLQKQRVQLGIRVQKMETTLNYYTNSRKKVITLLSSYLFLFIICWIRQRKYNKALAHEIVNHTCDNTDIIEDEDDDDDQSNSDENEIELDTHEDEHGDNNKNNSKHEPISISIDDQPTPDLLNMKVDLSGSDERRTKSVEIAELTENIINRFETEPTLSPSQEGQIIVQSSVLAKVQQLRMQLEDFQAILKLNENPFTSRSPAPSPKKMKQPNRKPDYMKHRRTNSSNIRKSLELP